MKFFSLVYDWTDSDVGFSDFPSTEITGQQTSRINPTSSSVWVHDCIFELKNTFYGSGGAISYTKSKSLLLVEKSIFSQCKSTSTGGAIYKSSGECVVKQCCGLQCYSTSNPGQFIFTSVSSSSSKNRVLDSSVSNSMKDSENPSYR